MANWRDLDTPSPDGCSKRSGARLAAWEFSVAAASRHFVGNFLQLSVFQDVERRHAPGEGTQIA